MSFLSDLAERLRALLFRGRAEREMNEELRFHVEREAAERIRNGTAPETAAQAAEAINEELQLISREGLSQEELAAGKSQLKGQITLSLESVSSRMYRAAGSELYDEEYKTLDELLAIVDGISQETVAEVTREFFTPEAQTVVSLGPRAAS